MKNTAHLVLSSLLLLVTLVAHAQTQDDFNNKLGDIYNAGEDKKKATAIAKQLYNMVQGKKDLQTYSNYYLLKTIFENPVGDSVMAKTCGDKAQKIMNAMVGLNTEMPKDTSNPTMAWSTYYFPALFTNKDPNMPARARQYIDIHPELKSFSNYTYVGYGFERINDFKNARVNYEEALKFSANDNEEYHSYIFYANFLTRTGDYLKADEYIRRMDALAGTANEYFKLGYQSEAMSARVVYYLNIGDYQSYVQASEKNYDYFSSLWHKDNTTPCDPYPGIRYTNAAFGREMMKDYDAAERLWKSRDSVNTIWVNCYNETYPNSHYYPESFYPIFLIKRGKFRSLPKSLDYYRKETEDHYNGYKQYADLGAVIAEATQLGFLYSPKYPELFHTIMDKVRATHDFRESTTPFSNYAYFCMRDRRWEEAQATYHTLFDLNVGWINDIIFTFGEKAFVTYYNARLRDGYQNFHSFVKLVKETQPALYPDLAGQAYNNLLFTKSISLQGTKKRKEAFLSSNDPAIQKLYDQWVDKKQQLIRLYLRAGEGAGGDTTAGVPDQKRLQPLQDEVTRLENVLTQQARDFKKYLSLTPPDWREVQKDLADDEAAIEMVRFSWRDKVYYTDTAYYAAYIIRKNSLHPDVVYLPDAASDLDTRFYTEYKNSIRRQQDDAQSYQHYWKPIADQLNGIHKVHFSPDGIYHLINLATLKNPASGKFVLDEWEIHYTTSGMDIKAGPSADEKIQTAVLMGRPSYKTEAPAGITVKPVERSFVRNFRDNNIPDLPGTEEEVRAIREELQAQNIRTAIFLKDEATEDQLYRLHSPGILHIATHGYWAPAGDNATEGYRVFNAMANSGLLLAGVVNYYSADHFPDTYDGILTAYEAENLDLSHTSLVILSACETNLGYLDAGEGVYGLQRAFRTAGAASIMTSLWKVDDAATRDFMIAFYKQYLRSGDKDAAFRSAQQSTKEKYKAPYFWGAFILTGR